MVRARSRGEKQLQAMLLSVAIVTLFVQSARAQSHNDVPASEPATVLLGVYPTAFLPFGHWRQHPYAGKTVGEYRYPDGMTLFGPGYGATLEVGVQIPWQHSLIRHITLAVLGDLTTLGTSTWERVAAEAGSEISVSATQGGGYLMAGLELLRAGSWSAELRAGLGAMLVSCHEQYPELGVDYDYDSFGVSFSMMGSAHAYWELVRGLDLAVIASMIYGPSGASYVGTATRPYLGTMIALGPRLRFEPLVGAE